MKTTIISFPTTIEECTYVRTLHNEPVRLSYQFALYEDKNGKKYLCKMCGMDSSIADRNGLENEIRVYQAFRAISPSIRSKASDMFPHFVIPEMLSWHSSDTMIYLLIEYLPGTFLSQSNSKIQSVEIYAQASLFFQELSKSSAFIRAIPQKRTVLHFFILFHQSFVGSLIRFPAQWKFILSSAPRFYRGLFAMALDGKMNFVHRDLGGDNNVLLTKDHVVLIDYQISVLTHPLVELANIIASRKLDSDFSDAFFQSDVWRDLKRSGRNVLIFRSLLLYESLHNVFIGTPKDAVASLDIMKRALSL